MAFAGIYVMFFRECFPDLFLIGKIILAPTLIAAAILTIPFCIGEFVLVDVWVFVLALLSKDMTLSDVLEFYFG